MILDVVQGSSPIGIGFAAILQQLEAHVSEDFAVHILCAIENAYDSVGRIVVVRYTSSDIEKRWLISIYHARTSLRLRTKP
jgi:hypothetical protein